MMKLIKACIYLPILAIIFTACNGDNDGVNPQPDVPEASPKTLVESVRIFQRPVGDLKGFISVSGLDVDVDLLVHNVTMYDVIYNTMYKGESIEASAVMLVPDTEDTVSTISFQHGTIASDAEAPSNLQLGDGQIILASALSSLGMVVVLPDFIGFGASVEIMHPYYVEDLTATSVMDAIYASRQLADELELSIDTDLYLAGYSQGGYATMATHKHIEESGADFYDLRASFPSSGGYDIKAFQEYFFDLETYRQPFFLTYVANAYKESFDWHQPLSTFFNEPYASEIPDYFDGSLSGSQINERLNDTITVLVNADFLSNPEASEYDFVTDAFRENSLTDWTPGIKMFMYHGDADITVPYQNSVGVYAQLLANGASEDVVSFTTLPGGTHGTGISPYIEQFIGELVKMEP